MKPHPILVSGTVTLLSLSSIQAAAVWFDVTTGGSATGSSNNFPAGEPPEAAIDGSFYTKYLNFDKTNTGFTVTGANSAVPVTRMILVTANDAPERDPASYTLEGSNDGSSWTSISSGALSLPNGRNSSISDFALNYQSVSFANSAAFAQYRVTFPGVRNEGGANSMQIAGVSLLGLYNPGPNVLEMQSYVVSSFGSGSYPGGESPAHAVDYNPETKYLNFGKEGNGMVFSTATGQNSIITGITLSQANDAPARDVTSFTLRGSTDGVNFTDIVTNQAIAADMGLFESNTVSFANTTPYRDYQFIVNGLRSSGDANSFQFSDIQLHGNLVPETSVGLLGLLGSVALLRRRR